MFRTAIAPVAVPEVRAQLTVAQRDALRSVERVVGFRRQRP